MILISSAVADLGIYVSMLIGVGLDGMTQSLGIEILVLCII
jgi:hypothetical protein